MQGENRQTANQVEFVPSTRPYTRQRSPQKIHKDIETSSNQGWKPSESLTAAALEPLFPDHAVYFPTCSRAARISKKPNAEKSTLQINGRRTRTREKTPLKYLFVCPEPIVFACAHRCIQPEGRKHRATDAPSAPNIASSNTVGTLLETTTRAGYFSCFRAGITAVLRQTDGQTECGEQRLEPGLSTVGIQTEGTNQLSKSRGAERRALSLNRAPRVIG